MLPDDVFEHIVGALLDRSARSRLVRACFPRAVVVSRWSHGARTEYALGMQEQEQATCDPSMRLEHAVALRGNLYALTERVGLCATRDCGFARASDRKRVGALFSDIRGLVRARDAGKRSDAVARRLLGFRSLEAWGETLADLRSARVRTDARG